MDNSKQSDFISESRQISHDYIQFMATLKEHIGRWNALYNTLIVEADFIGENEGVIPSGEPATRLASLVSCISNYQAIVTAFEAGINTNMERLSA